MNKKSPTEVVTDFIHAWAESWDSLLQSFKDTLADDCVYANSGLPTWQGKELILQTLEQIHLQVGLERIVADQLTIVAEGCRVVVERKEQWFDTNSDAIFEEQEGVLGLFEVKNSKIVGFRDYFDPRGMLALMDNA